MPNKVTDYPGIIILDKNKKNRASLMIVAKQTNPKRGHCEFLSGGQHSDVDRSPSPLVYPLLGIHLDRHNGILRFEEVSSYTECCSANN